MSEHLVPRQTEASDTAEAGSLHPRPPLPPEVVRDAAKRLGAVSLLYAFAYGTSFFAPLLILVAANQPIPTEPFPVFVAVISVAASLVIFMYARGTRLPPNLLVDLGLVYNVVGSFGIAMGELWGVEVDLAILASRQWTGISWVCVWIIVFPVLVPSTPGKTLLSTLTAAAMAPLALLISIAAGATTAVPWLFWTMLLVTTYVCAVLGFVCFRIVYGLGARLEKAREMGNYRLIERLGSGGMGDVWLAQHRMLARPAAIKLIRQDHLSPTASEAPATLRARFEREARATAALTSPHSVKLYDYGITQSGQFYYAMELLEGIDLSSLVQRFGPLPAERVVHLLIQACESLADAHYHGVIHRDIKPANLFTCRRGPIVDFIKVVDFGLVKVFGEPSEEETQLTAQGVTAGTPAYMAPEMAMANTRLDPRADIYSLGCVGYRLLTGKHVFDADTPISMLLHHAKTPAAPPSAHTEIPIPEELEQIILQCLAKNRDDRPSSAAELAQRLEDTGLGAAWDRERAREWWDLHLPAAD